MAAIGPQHVPRICNISSGGAWNASAAKVIQSGNQNSYAPSLTSNGTGYAAAWSQYDDAAGVYQIYANVFSSLTDTTGDAAVKILYGAGDASMQRIFRNGAGYAAVWMQYHASGGNDIFAGRYDGAWTYSGMTATGLGASEYPAIATNRHGETLAVWAQYDTGVPYAFGRLNKGGAWGAPFRIATSPLTSKNRAVNVATNGADFLVAYASADGVMARTCDRSGTLGAETGLRDPSNENPVYGPWVASNGLGYAVVWLQSLNFYNSVYANIYDGSAWGGASLLENADYHAYLPLMAVSNGSGYAVVWRQWDGVSVDIYANVFTTLTAATKDGATLIENSSQSADAPVIASNGTSYAAAWAQSDGTAKRIYSNIFSSLTASTKDGAAALSSGFYDALDPTAASDGAGYAISWRQWDGAGAALSIFANFYDNAAWTGQRLLEMSSDPVQEPKMTSNGKLYSVIWKQRDPVDALVYNIWARLGVGADSAEMGTTANPVIIYPDPACDSWSLPFNGAVGTGALYFKITGFNPNSDYDVTLTSMTANADLYVYSDAFVTLQCTSAKIGADDEYCPGTTTDSGGALYIKVDGSGSASGTTFTLLAGT